MSGTMIATWNETVLAQSDETIVVEGNHYFPPDSINWEALEPSEHHSHCGWKGQASYYHVVSGGERNSNAAWTYPDPLPAARQIKDFLAFWHGVQVSAREVQAANGD